MKFPTAMERILHLTLLLSGLCSPTSCLLKDKFLLVTNKKSWKEAQTFCRENCFDLATIYDMKEMKEVYRIVKGRFDEPVWIGLTKTHQYVWQWSLEGDEFYKEGEREYFTWKSSEGYCVTFKLGELATALCDKGKKAVCFDGRVSHRPKYVLISYAWKWPKAQSLCRSRYTDLLSVRNETEMQILQKVAAGSRVWIGRFRDAWKWSDKNTSSFRHWILHKPLDDHDGHKCAALTETGKWEVFACEDKHPFLCHCPTQRIIRVRIRREDSALDLNNTAVQEHILKEINQKLVDKNINVDAFRLKWRKQPDGGVFIKEQSEEETTEKSEDSRDTTCKDIPFD